MYAYTQQRPRRGFGANPLRTTGQYASAAGGIVATILALIPATGPAAPFVAIGAALVGLAASMFRGCGQTCIVASNDANKAEQLLKQNLDAYFASARTSADRAAALDNFDTFWRELQQACGDPALGKAGANCIADRQAGACKWTNDGRGGRAGSGTVCWNWFVGYRDPIANDTPTDAGSVNSLLGGILPTGLPEWVIPAALIALGAAL